MNRIRWWLTLAAWGLAAPALAEPGKPGRVAQRMVIENCVSADKLSFRPGVSGALLDPADTLEVAQSIVDIYPMIERHGLYPKAIALWRKPGGDWLYATLTDKPEAPHSRCFSANVTAGNVKQTTALLKKYFGIVQTPM